MNYHLSAEKLYATFCCSELNRSCAFSFISENDEESLAMKGLRIVRFSIFCEWILCLPLYEETTWLTLLGQYYFSAAIHLKNAMSNKCFCRRQNIQPESGSFYNASDITMKLFGSSRWSWLFCCSPLQDHDVLPVILEVWIVLQNLLCNFEL